MVLPLSLVKGSIKGKLFNIVFLTSVLHGTEPAQTSTEFVLAMFGLDNVETKDCCAYYLLRIVFVCLLTLDFEGIHIKIWAIHNADKNLEYKQI